MDGGCFEKKEKGRYLFLDTYDRPYTPRITPAPVFCIHDKESKYQHGARDCTGGLRRKAGNEVGGKGSRKRGGHI